MTTSIIMESNSRNTRENATHTREILKEQGWQHFHLVTTAIHMRRAMGVFRAAGLTPSAAPTQIKAQPPADYTLFSLLPDPGYLGHTTQVLREYLGWLYYQLRGWI